MEGRIRFMLYTFWLFYISTFVCYQGEERKKEEKKNHQENKTHTEMYITSICTHMHTLNQWVYYPDILTWADNEQVAEHKHGMCRDIFKFSNHCLHIGYFGFYFMQLHSWERGFKNEMPKECHLKGIKNWTVQECN